MRLVVAVEGQLQAAGTRGRSSPLVLRCRLLSRLRFTDNYFAGRRPSFFSSFTLFLISISFTASAQTTTIVSTSERLHGCTIFKAHPTLSRPTPHKQSSAVAALDGHNRLFTLVAVRASRFLDRQQRTHFDRNYHSHDLFHVRRRGQLVSLRSIPLGQQPPRTAAVQGSCHRHCCCFPQLQRPLRPGQQQAPRGQRVLRCHVRCHAAAQQESEHVGNPHFWIVRRLDTARICCRQQTHFNVPTHILSLWNAHY